MKGPGNCFQDGLQFLSDGNISWYPCFVISEADFTGGEPFLNFELLLGAVEIAERFHIPSTFGDYLELTRGENLAKQVELFLMGRAALR